MSGEQHDQYVADLEASHAQLLETLATIITMAPPADFVVPRGSNRASNMAAVAAHAIRLAFKVE